MLNGSVPVGCSSPYRTSPFETIYPHAGQPHRSLVFASQNGRAELQPGPGTSLAAELSMSRPDIAPTSLSPAVEAVNAAQVVEPLQPPAVEQATSLCLEQVRLICDIPTSCLSLLSKCIVCY